MNKNTLRNTNRLFETFNKKSLSKLKTNARVDTGALRKSLLLKKKKNSEMFEMLYYGKFDTSWKDRETPSKLLRRQARSMKKNLSKQFKKDIVNAIKKMK